MQQRPEIVAHRGASAYAPEHTFDAYDLALELGADAIELDVRATLDGRLVVLHDPTLARTTGDPRPIGRVRADELRGPRRPPGLGAVLSRYAGRTRLFVELKDPAPAMEQAVAGALRSAGAGEEAVVQSFDHRALRRLRRSHPELELAPLFCETTHPRAVLAALKRVARWARGVGVFHPDVDAALMQAARAHGLRIRAYTVNEGDELARLAALGVDGLITDVPDRALAAACAAAVALAA